MVKLSPINAAKHFLVVDNGVVVAEVKEISFSDADANEKRMGNSYRIEYINGEVAYAEDIADVQAKF